MRLSRITLSGFKSFADKTVVDFSVPVVGIVGPNGCGKSNVVDAIKWVLGEQSAKSLRGGAMLDVIFNGSASRKPAGMASVTLHFENLANAEGERALPVNADEVGIQRRLYRDGTSEYLINNQKVRLRDIRTLFYDTGIGTNAYSIIEQGKVDSMLSSSPADRRMIFEEAAGISKFKSQKKEASRKLERTEQNLLRSRDKLAEVQRRLRSVKVQATRARNWTEYTDRLRTLRLEYALAEYHKLTGQLKQIEQKLKDGEEARSRATAQLSAAEDQRTGAEAERQQVLNHRHEMQQAQLRFEAQRDQAQQRLQFATSTETETSQQIEQQAAHRQELMQRAQQLEQQMAEQDQALTRLQTAVDEAQQAIAQSQDDQRQALHELNEAQARSEDEKAGIVNLLRRTTDLHNQINALSLREENLTSHQQRLTSRADELAGELEQLLTDRDESTEKLDEINHLIEAETQRLNDQKNAAAELGESQQRLTEKLATSKEQRSALDSRRDLLGELEQSQTGVDEAVKAVLARRAASGEFAFVRGLLAEMIKTDVQHAGAVEAALGPYQQALIVDRFENFQTHHQQLESLSGRVTFVALDRLPAPRHDAHPAAAGIERLIDHVGFDPTIGPLLWHLLGKTLIVDDLNSAIELQKKLPAGYRLVTRDAQVLEPDGRLIGGPLNEASGAGLISRRSELADLHGKIEGLEDTIGADQTHLQQLSDRAAHIEKVQQELRQAVYEASTVRVELNGRIERCQQAIERIEAEQPVVSAEVEQLHRQIRETSTERDGHRQNVAELEQQQQDSKNRTEALEKQIQELREHCDQLAEAATAARVEAGKTTEQLTAARKQRSQLSLARDEADRQAEGAQRQLDELRGRLEQVRQDRQRAHQQIAEAEQQIAEVQEELAGFVERLEAVDQRITELNQTVVARRQEAEQIEQQSHEQEVARRELEVRLESVRERAREQLSLEIDQAYQNYDEQGIDWEAVETEITELKQKISRLGSVNVGAIDEQEELEQREVDLAEEIGDIDKARGELEDLIQYLNEESRNRFQSAFEQIRENFAGSGGLFRKLFGGGRADLVLMPDENGDSDWLESGIEVIAKPPGKEPQTIRLLSGGERTMVAVALLLSIFRSRPSPFCVLDEVDAALDEANVDRFVNVIRSFLDHSHFIVITHHKRTMQAADQLYGITMPIRGVSKPVSVKFDQVSASGRLSADAMAKAKADAEKAPEPDPEPAEEPEPAIEHTPKAQKLADLVESQQPIEVKRS